MTFTRAREMPMDMGMGMGMIEAIPFGFWKGDVADRPADNDKGAATQGTHSLQPQDATAPVGQ